GVYDEVGEFMPNLVFTDKDGAAFELLDQTDRLLVISVCTEWCTPCFRYSSQLDDIASEAGTDFSFVEVLMENSETGLSRTIDAVEWTNRFSLETPVVTVNGDRAFYLDFIRGAFVDAFPLYLVVDGTTGEIVGRFNAFFDQDTLLDQLFDIAD